jgi:predicted metal-binding membrane protein
MNLSDLEVRPAPERPIDVDTSATSDRPVALSLLVLSLLASLFWAGLVLGGLVLEYPVAAHSAQATAAAPDALAAARAGGVAASVDPSLAWHAGQLALVFLTWAGLCTALMLPLASRAAVLFARLAGRRAAQRARLRTALFVLGYLGAWTGFALLAAIAQWTLHAGPGGTIRHPLLLGLILVAAGVYQWTPAKHACLAHCRAPLTSILAGWRDGLPGAFRHGVAHAHEALGCCWLLMLLLLAAGPDNPGAIVIVGLFVLAEMRLASGHPIACAGGLALIALGTGLLFP